MTLTWSQLYLFCFLVGFGLSVLALLAGTAHVHVPHLDLHHGFHLPDGHPGGVDGHGGLPWFNFGTIAAFLAWFGGTGYLLASYSSLWFGVALIVSTLSGLAASAAVFWFLAKVLMRHDVPLDPADYDMIGVLGHLSIPIRVGGTGELVYAQEGTRHVAGARSEDGKAIPKGAEVVVTRYDKGIAYVRPWQDFAGEMDPRS